jgi:hypothetical protein
MRNLQSPISNLLFSFLLGVVLLLQACRPLQDANTEKQSGLKNAPVLNKGVLSFKSRNDFADLMNFLSIPKKLEDFEIELESKGFKSLNKKNHVANDGVFRKTNSDYDDQDPVEIVEDQYFATVLNEQGLVSIEGAYFRITRDFVFWTYDTDPYFLNDDNYLSGLVSKQPEILKVNSQASIDETYPLYYDDNSGVYFGGIVRHEPIVNDGGADIVGPLPPLLGPEFEKPVQGLPALIKEYLSGSRRVVCESWNTSWLVYASLGSLTKHQSKYGPIWIRSKTNEVYVNSIASWRIKIQNSVVKGDTRDSVITTKPNSDTGTHVAKVRHDFRVALFTTTLGDNGQLSGRIRNTVSGYNVDFVRAYHRARTPELRQWDTYLPKF